MELDVLHIEQLMFFNLNFLFKKFSNIFNKKSFSIYLLRKRFISLSKTKKHWKLTVSFMFL